VRFAVLFLLASALTASVQAADDPLAAAHAKLAKLDMVTGEAWGFANSPGEFFTLASVFIEKGEEADCRKMLTGKNPIVRAMGVYCLARSKEEAALPDLKARLGDSGAFDLVPNGCTVERATVGTLAFCLILDRNYLHLKAERRPLLKDPALTDLCVEVLLRDECVDIRMYPASARSETWRAFSGLAQKGLAGLRKALPKRSVAEIAKAVGRLPPDEASRSLLSGIASSFSEKRSARLAAASGLTRDADPIVRLILEQQQGRLNAKDPAKPGTRFVVEARMLRAKTWTAGKAHPVHLPRIQARLNIWMAVPEPGDRKKLIGELKTLADDLGRHTNPWDTWSDAPYRFRRLLDLYRDVRLQGAHKSPLVSEKEEKDLRRRIAPFLK